MILVSEFASIILLGLALLCRGVEFGTFLEIPLKTCRQRAVPIKKHLAFRVRYALLRTTARAIPARRLHIDDNEPEFWGLATSIIVEITRRRGFSFASEKQWVGGRWKIAFRSYKLRRNHRPANILLTYRFRPRLSP